MNAPNREKLGRALGFVDVQPQLPLAGIGVGSDLGRARVIPTGGVERVLDQRTRRGYRRARLARVNQRAHADVGQRDPLVSGDLGEAERVRHGAHQHGWARRLHHLQPRASVGAASRNRQRTEMLCAGVRAPEPDEGSERKREKQSIARRDPGARVDVLPAFDPPGPAVQRVDDGERLSLRTGGLVVLRVLIGRIGRDGAEGRMGLLIGNEIRFRHDRETGEPVPVERCLHTTQRSGVKRVARQNRREQIVQSCELPLADLTERRPLNSGVQVTSCLSCWQRPGTAAA
jgi:hypothetical protein